MQPSAAGAPVIVQPSGGGTALPGMGSSNSGSPLITKTAPAKPASCKAGHYIGSFGGNYRPGALNGEQSVPFITADANGRPGFEFWLEAVDMPCTPGQEFCVGAVVKGGKLRGNASSFADGDNPPPMDGSGFSTRFEIDLTGELDCNAGKFKGKLENGCYDIFSVLFRFDGTIVGDYSLTANAFTGGTWQVSEKAPPDAEPAANMLGGDGMWSATYADDSSAPTDTSVGLCKGQSGLDTPL